MERFWDLMVVSVQPLCRLLQPFIDRKGRQVTIMPLPRPEIDHEWIEEDWCDSCDQPRDFFWMRWQPYDEIEGYCTTCDHAVIGIRRSR